jgi:hypothetical protein
MMYSITLNRYQINMLAMTDINVQLIKFLPAFFAISITFFLGAGWLLGRYRTKKFGDAGVVIGDALLTAIFGLSALVLGLTFSNASNHYETRVEGVRAQANAIKEVYESTRYLQPSDQAALKESLSRLLDLRLQTYSDLKRLNDVAIATDSLAKLVRQINVDVAKAVVVAPSENKALLFETITLQTRNLVSTFNMGDIKTKSHPPLLMVRFIYTLLCVASLLIGYTVAIRGETDWFLATVYLLLMGFGIYVILSLEYPNLLMPFEEFNEDLLLLKNSLGST